MFEKEKTYISHYFSEEFIKAVERYENLVHFSIRENQKFRDSKTSYGPEQLHKKTFSELRLGGNPGISIEVVCLRALVYYNVTYILAVQGFPLESWSKFICVVVMGNPEKQNDCKKWEKDIALNMSLLIREPNIEIIENSEMHICSVSSSNASVQPGKRWKERVEELKEKGNEAYKKSQFLSALYLYQFALASCHKFSDTKTRAILYSNSSLCLMSIRLFEISLKYSSLAIKIDSTYQKSYDRKIRSLLEVKRFNDIPPLLLTLHSSKMDAQNISKYNKKYTVCLCNSIGMYNWKEVFQQPRKQASVGDFGEYYSKKIGQRIQGNRFMYIANEPIKQYQIILLSKPIILNQHSHEEKDIYSKFDEIQRYTALQKSFYQAINQLPSDYHLEGQKNMRKGFIDKQQLNRKMRRCLELQKDLEKLEKPSVKRVGVWAQMFKFSHSCLPNCSFVHLRSVMCLSASKNIPKGQLLTLDYVASIEARERKQVLADKYGIRCKCKVCEWKEIPLNVKSNKEIQKICNKLDSLKMKKQYYWELIRHKVIGEDYKVKLERYVELVRKQTHWDDILNLFRLLRDEKEPENIVLSRAMLVKGISHFLKVPIDETSELIDLIL